MPRMWCNMLEESGRETSPEMTEPLSWTLRDGRLKMLNEFTEEKGRLAESWAMPTQAR